MKIKKEVKEAMVYGGVAGLSTSLVYGIFLQDLAIPFWIKNLAVLGVCFNVFVVWKLWIIIKDKIYKKKNSRSETKKD